MTIRTRIQSTLGHLSSASSAVGEVPTAVALAFAGLVLVSSISSALAEPVTPTIVPVTIAAVAGTQTPVEAPSAPKFKR